ncbi:MAG: O-antigen translocase [Flavobacteriaceae bacterium]|nr:O-antigen translocase [Flavobacteriaceae bacterium]
MNFVKTSFYSAIGTSVSLIVKLITNKFVAVYLSTSGMFLIGQLKDFLKITSVISNFGTLNGTVTYTARYKEDVLSLKSVLSTSFKIHLYFSLAVCAFTLIFKAKLSEYLFNSSDYESFLTVLAFSIVSISIHTLFMSVLNGLKQIKLYVLINIIATILSALVLIVLIIKYSTIGAFYAFAIGQLLTFLVSLILISIFKPFSLKLLIGQFNNVQFKKLSKFSLMALAGPICLISATFFVRYFLASEFDQNHAGSWEGMWRISAMYLLFLTTTFKFYLLPTFSTLEGIQLKKEVFKVWKFMLPIIVIIALTVYFLRDFVINTLLDKEFFLVGTLIGFHLIGDTIKINGWVLGNILIAKAKTKAFIFFQIEWALVFAVLTFVFVKNYGFVGVSIAYFLAYLIHFILMNVYFRKLLWVKP